MKELSIFVDESGDFGEYEKHAPYYIISMIFHDQERDISNNINFLNNSLKQIGYGEQQQAIHTEPLIRREKPYQYFQLNERRAIFTKLYYFALDCEIKYKSFVFYKSEYENKFKLEARIAIELSRFIKDNLDFFQNYEKVILYYDNGQHELNRILNTVMATQLSNYDFRKVLPSDYRLFQVADLICTVELLRIKSEKGNLSNSEERIFHGLIYCTLDEYLNNEYHVINSDKHGKILCAGQWIYYTCNDGVHRVKLDGSEYQEVKRIMNV